MKREQLTEKILDIKRAKGWTWKHITDEIGGMSPVLVVGALLGQMKLVKPLAKKAGQLFGLSDDEQAMLNEVPHRGTAMPPTDPLIYRFYELVMVNGPAWKALIEEEFGDGIMSAIDFDMEIERLPNPKGDRVKVTMSGKFLPYKYYGSSGNMRNTGTRKIRERCQIQSRLDVANTTTATRLTISAHDRRVFLLPRSSNRLNHRRELKEAKADMDTGTIN